jgi:hypothetical protein
MRCRVLGVLLLLLSPGVETVSELLREFVRCRVLGDDLGMQDTRLGNVVAVVLDVCGFRGIGEQLADARGVPPDEAGRGKLVVVVKGAPQDLQKVGFLRACESRDVAEVELGDRQQGIRLGVSRMPCLELGEIRALVGVEEVFARLAGAKPGRFKQRPPLADAVEGDRRVRVVVFLCAGRPFLVGRPQEWSADGAVVNGRSARAGVQADSLPGQRRQLREYGRDVNRPGWGGSRHSCSFSSHLGISGGLYMRDVTVLSTVGQAVFADVGAEEQRPTRGRSCPTIPRKASA